MKKLLALVLVLGMAAISNAAVVDIAVGPNSDRAVEELTINVSDTVQLGLYRTGTTAYLSGIYYVLVADKALGSIQGGVPVIYPSSNMDGIIQANAAIYDPASAYNPALPEGVDGMGYAYFNFDEVNEDEFESPESVPAGLHFTDIIFHCEAIGDTLVQVMTASDVGAGTVWTVRDTLLIHQVPEPVTMSLLALGGLALLRRRRA
jgi:hypothetical protein